MEMLGKTLLEKMAMLMNVIMVEKEKTATGMSAQRRVSRARGTEEGAPRGDSLHFHNYCTDPVSESAHQEEDDFNPQTSPASDTQDDQRNTEPNSGRNGEDAQCGGEPTGGDSLHFHNDCTDPVSESAHQEEDDFNLQTSPALETQDNQRNTEPNSGRNGEDAQCGGEPTGGQKYPPRGAPGQVEERGERRVAFRDRRQNDSEAPLGYSIERPVDQGERAARGRGGGRGRGMRGNSNFRSTDGFDQRGKREFERHSGSDRTGVRPEEKRGGSGPRNWGSMRDHMSAAADGAPTEGGDGDEVADSAETGANRAPETEGEGEAVVEVSVEMSLDEWKALQEQNRPKREFNLRKADTIVPSDSVVIHKSKKQVEEGVEEDDAAALRRPANDITAKLKIDFGSLGRPSRGTRGGGRGGRGGPATRPETISPQKPPEKARFQQGQAPNPDDPEDFPALA